MSVGVPPAAWALEPWSAQRLAAVETRLQAWVPAHAPGGLGAAMRYAVLDGGKRLRPLLALAAAEALVDATQLPELVWRAACSVELIHAYSLVHDDMPCMDNDVLRRGKPTVHVAHGEAMALLAGDALQALAFEVLLNDEAADGRLIAHLCRTLAHAAGQAGMAGGQAIDLASVGQRLDQAQLERMHRCKTGALLQASIRMGAMAVGAQAAQLTSLDSYGAALGLAFQVVDDILDVTADAATLGKTAGKDAADDKPTFVSLLGLDGARAQSERLLDEALQALAAANLNDTRALQALALQVVRRHH